MSAGTAGGKESLARAENHLILERTGADGLTGPQRVCPKDGDLPGLRIVLCIETAAQAVC